MARIEVFVLLAAIFLLGTVVFPFYPCLAVARDDRDEFRGGWVVSWEGMISPQKIDEVVQGAVAANLNVLVAQVRSSGDAFYNSNIVPRSELLQAQPSDFDPLGYLLEQARPLGIQIQAWLNMGLLWRSETPPADARHIFNAHRDWLLIDEAGKLNPAENVSTGRILSEGPYWLDFGVPEVQRHLAEVALEIVEKYDVDGIHYDYIRYPARMGLDNIGVGYAPLAVARFREETGKEPLNHTLAFDSWRTAQVTNTVALIYQKVKAKKPELEISAAVLAPWDLGLGRTFQDPRQWLQMGIIDLVLPMSYSTDNLVVRKDGWNYLEVADGSQVVLGLNKHGDPGLLAKQIEISRDLGLRGFCIFPWNGYDPEYCRQLRDTVLNKAVKVGDIKPQRLLDTRYTSREPLLVRVGEASLLSPSFTHRFFTRRGKTLLIIEQIGVTEAEIKLQGKTVPLPLLEERTTVDISDYVSPRTNPTPASNTVQIQVKAQGEPGFSLTVYIEDRFAQ